jgi:hypothetical protein
VQLCCVEDDVFHKSLTGGTKRPKLMRELLPNIENLAWLFSVEAAPETTKSLEAIGRQLGIN